MEGCVGQVYFLVGQALKTSEIPTIFILVLENGDLKGRGVVICGFKDWPSILIQILLTENQGCVVSIRHGYLMCLDWIRRMVGSTVSCRCFQFLVKQWCLGDYRSL